MKDKYFGQIYISDDRGKNWRQTGHFPFYHARPFEADGRLYILGHNSDLMIIRSDDEGETWSDPVKLSEGEFWHQSACNVWYKDESVYLVMERIVYKDGDIWPVSVIAPVLMRGRVEDDLTMKDNWTFADEFVFRDVIDQEKLNFFGVPFYKTPRKEKIFIAPGRSCSPIGWLETNVVQIMDPDHYWYDPSGKTFLLLSRARTGGTGYCALSQVYEREDGSMVTGLVTMPSGVQAAFLPIPGGHMRFHIIYDEQTKLYWLLSTQSTDSMVRVDRLQPDRFNLPNNERQRLQLHFSKNCVDWCFAGLVAIGGSQKQSRHYASMIIDENDLIVLSRSGDERAKSAHDGNIITFHRIYDFRSLVY